MRAFLIGVIAGIVLAFLFVYVGGGKFLKKMGKEAIEIGEQLEGYEKVVKEKLPFPKR